MDKNTKSTEKRGLKAFLKSRKARYGAVATGIVLGTVAIVIVINIIVGLLVERFPELIKSGDIVLVKASHSMQFEKLVDYLKEMK